MDTEDQDTQEKSDYDCLFDPADDSEIGHGEITLAEDVVIGRQRTREEDGKHAREPKTAKVESKRVKRDTSLSLRPGLRAAHEQPGLKTTMPTLHSRHCTPTAEAVTVFAGVMQRSRALAEKRYVRSMYRIVRLPWTSK